MNFTGDVPKIVGLKGMSDADLQLELQQGGRFVVYQCCASIIVLAFRWPSDIHFIPAHKSAVVKGLGYSLICLLCGWWCFPWGPLWTIEALVRNLGGGKDVTQETLAALRPAKPDPFAPSPEDPGPPDSECPYCHRAVRSSDAACPFCRFEIQDWKKRNFGR